MRTKPKGCKRIIALLVTGLISGVGAVGTAQAQDERVTDPGFEATTLHDFFRQAGVDPPWMFGEWNAEDSTLIMGTDGATGISPIDSWMLRVNSTGGVGSQVSQMIDVDGLTSDCCCRTLATYGILVNAPEATAVRLVLATGTGQSVVGTPQNRDVQSVAMVTDDDPDTWELLEGARALQPGTTVLELQIAVNNNAIPTDGVFFDEASVVLETNLVTDGCLEPGTTLHAFFRQGGVDPPWMAGEWNVESATIESGPIAGIVPKNGAGMLQVNATGGTASQVNQIIALASSVSGDETVGTWSVCVNAPEETPVSLHMSAGDGQNPLVGTLTNQTTRTVSLTTDDDPQTWQVLEGSRFLPDLTSHLEIQVSAPNAQIDADGFFVDCANVTLAINRLTDENFEAGTVLHSFYRAAGSDPPWMPGEWNQEDADLVGAVSGVTPFSGAAMLRINSTGGVASQVNQLIAVPPDVYASGDAMAIFAIHVNAPVGVATPVTLTMRAAGSQTSVGTLFMPTTATASLTTEGDETQWEVLEGSLMLPSGTKYLEMQISAPNAQIDAEGFFVDLGRVTFVRCELSLIFNTPVLGGAATLALMALLGGGGVVLLRRRGRASSRG